MAGENVVLTGFMATGKSTVGRLLAIALDFEWVDTDALIEARYGPIDDIFQSNGEESFREMERRVAGELAGRRNLVISTGGRMMLDAENARVLGRSARVFCLTAEPEELLRRAVAQDGPERPLLTGGHPADRIRELLSERAEAYAQFEQVPTEGRAFGEIVQDILERLLVPPA